MALEAYTVRRPKTMNPATINLPSLCSRQVGIAQGESTLAKLRKQAGETRECIDLMFPHTNGKSVEPGNLELEFGAITATRVHASIRVPTHNSDASIGIHAVPALQGKNQEFVDAQTWRWQLSLML